MIVRKREIRTQTTGEVKGKKKSEIEKGTQNEGERQRSKGIKRTQREIELQEDKERISERQT